MNEQFNGATFFHVPVNFRLVIFYDISYKVNINLNGKKQTNLSTIENLIIIRKFFLQNLIANEEN